MPDCSGLRLDSEVKTWLHDVQVSHSGGLAVKSTPNQLCTNLVVGSGEFFSLLQLFNYEHTNTQLRQCFLPQYAISVSQGQGCESALTVQFLHQQSAPHPMLPAMTRCVSRVQSDMFPAKTQNSRRAESLRGCYHFPKQPRPPEASETSPSDYSLIFQKYGIGHVTLGQLIFFSVYLLLAYMFVHDDKSLEDFFIQVCRVF